MDVIVALVLGVVGLIVAGMIFYARRNDLVYLIRSPAEAYLGVRRNSPLSAAEPEPQPTKGSLLQGFVRPVRHLRLA